MGTSSQREDQGDTAAKRATERIQRLSGGVAEADPWGGVRDTVSLWVCTCSLSKNSPRSLFPFPLEVKELIALGSNCPKSRDLAVQYNNRQAELFQNQVSNRR